MDHELRADGVRCPHCRIYNHSYAVFCISCGEPLDEAISSPQPTPAAGPTEPHRSESEQQQPLVAAGATHGGFATRFARREAIIGIAVLLLALGLAVNQWQRSSEQAAAFNDGVAAEQQRNWDKAAEAFARAGDHPGAAEKASNALGKTMKRNRLYLQGLVAEERGDWKTTVDSLEQVETIQPNFADTEQRLRRAQEQTATLGLEGIVMRTSREGSDGLYYLDGEGKILMLPGSDKNSAIRAWEPSGQTFVYDRSSKCCPTATPATPLAGVMEANSPLPAARREIVMVDMNPHGMKTTVLPGLDPGGAGIIGADGLWWHNQSMMWDGYPQDAVYYVPRSGNGSTSPHMVAGQSSDRKVIAFDPANSRLVISEASKDPASGEETTRLYLTEAGGENPVLLPGAGGSVRSASVSPDGRWLLYVSEQRKDAGTLRRAWAQSLQPDDEEVYPHFALLEPDYSARSPIERLNLKFVPSSGRPTRVLVTYVQGGIESLSGYDLETHREYSIWAGRTAGFASEDVAGFSPGGDYLASPRRYETGNLLEMIRLSRPDYQRWFNVPLPMPEDRPAEVSFSPLGDYILAAVKNYRHLRGRLSQNLYAAQVDDAGGLHQVKLLAITLLSGVPTVATPRSGKFLAYIDNQGDLHSLHYDGTRDLIIAHDVTAVWNLGENPSLAWNR